MAQKKKRGEAILGRIAAFGYRSLCS